MAGSPGAQTLQPSRHQRLDLGSSSSAKLTTAVLERYTDVGSDAWSCRCVQPFFSSTVTCTNAVCVVSSQRLRKNCKTIDRGKKQAMVSLRNPIVGCMLQAHWT